MEASLRRLLFRSTSLVITGGITGYLSPVGPLQAWTQCPSSPEGFQGWEVKKVAGTWDMTAYSCKKALGDPLNLLCSFLSGRALLPAQLVSQWTDSSQRMMGSLGHLFLLP